MKQLATAGAFVASFLAFSPAVFAYVSPGSPNGYINDFAQVLSAEAKRTLESELASFNQTTSNEIAVAIVPNMGGDYIENYAVKLFAEWGIGKKDKDNGVLLVLSIEERKMRIEVGYGLEGALPDSVAQSILDNEMTPLLKAGDYDAAVTAGVHAIEQATKGEYTSSSEVQSAGKSLEESLLDGGIIFFVFGLFILQVFAAILSRSRSWWAGGAVGLLGGLGIGWFLALGLLLIIPLIIVLTMLGLLFDYVVSTGYQKAKTQGVTPPWWTGGSGGSSSSGGGFGGFGGGSSGGGGASGGW